MSSCFIIVLLIVLPPAAPAQKRVSKPSNPSPKLAELEKLRAEFIQATKEYQASLAKLLAIYQRNLEKEKVRLTQAQALYTDGLISRQQLEETELVVKNAAGKIDEVRQQQTTAEAQIANILVEAEADRKLARLTAKGSLVRTTSYIRYNGSANWQLPEVWKVQSFFLATFKRQLPIAVFGQGAIHDHWRLDHRNAVDLSLNPGSAEGQAVMNFLRANGIPFLAFTEAIPGTATGPHIHVGRPSHRY